MLDVFGNSLYVLAFILVKGIIALMYARQIMADIDPRIIEAGRLRKKDPAAADRFIREVAEELRDGRLNEDVPARRHGNFLTYATLVTDLIVLGYLAVKIPAATLPALLASAFADFGSWRSTPFERAKLFFPEPDPGSVRGLRIPIRKPLLYGMAAGAIGYAALGALGIGVPDPDAALGWRIFGGLVFGAAIGIFSSIFLGSAAVSIQSLRSSN
jgi:hypothetical protein